MSNGLRGFSELRTRLAVPEADPSTKRRCPKCGNYLAASNPGPLCRPCEFGHIEIPDWAEALVSDESDRMQLNTLAAAIAPEHVTLRRPAAPRPVQTPTDVIPPDAGGLELREIIVREFGTVRACTEAMGWPQAVLHAYWTDIPRRRCRLPEWRRQALNLEIDRRRRQRGGES